MKRHSFDDISRIAAALAHPVRVQIVERLACGGEMTCAEATKDLGRHQTTLNRHLGKLRRAGIVTARKDTDRSWRDVYVTLNKDALAAVCSLAA